MRPAAQRTSLLFALLLALALLGVSACGATTEEDPFSPNHSEEEDLDGDSDTADGDSDLDGDGTTDGDGGLHTDGDSDSNTDGDSDSENDSENGDDDGESDSDSNGDSMTEPAEPQPLGAFCNDSLPCEEDLICYRDLNPDADGFCTQRCEILGTGCGYAGPNLYLKCALSDDDGPLCGFICILDHGDHSHSYSCPSDDWGRLRCQLTAGPGGHRYCAPR